MTIADLTRTAWVPAADVHAGDRVVDWHDEGGRGVFDTAPRARHVAERSESNGTIEFVLTCDGQRRRIAKRPDALIEVQR